MRNQIFSSIERRSFALAIALLVTSNSSPLHAQTVAAPYRDLIGQVRAVTGASNLCYKYEVCLIDGKSKKETEKIKGAYYKVGKSFLDSNSYALSLLTDGYFFKTAAKAKTAYLYRLSTVEKKTGIKPSDFDNVCFSIPDSMATKLGTFAIAERNGNTELTYTLKDKGAAFNSFRFTIRKKDKRLLEIKMISPLDNGSQKEYRLMDFENVFDLKKISAAKYYSVSGNKAMLTGPFHNYKVQAIL